MTTRPTYETDAYRTHLEARVLDAASDERGGWVVLSDTVLHPGGGGQPRDHGRVAGVAVRNLVRTPEGLRHDLDAPPEAPLPEGAVTVTLDWERRFDHMVQHTAQHLLTAVAEQRLGLPTTSFHLGPDRCDIELDGPPPTRTEIDELEEVANAVVRENRPVRVRWISREEYDTRVDVRSRGLPDDHEGEVRLVEIDGLDLTACGGTHVSHTSEIETLKLLATESMRGGTRLHWVAGSRVRRRLAGHEDRAAALRGRLGVGDDELVGAVELRLDQLKTAQRQVRGLEGDLCEALIGQLLLRDGLLVTIHFEDKDAAFLRRLAAQFSEAGAGRTGFFTAGGSGGTLFAVATGRGAPARADTLGPVVAEALGGRGGGRGSVFQGKAPGSGRVEAASTALRRALEP